MLRFFGVLLRYLTITTTVLTIFIIINIIFFIIVTNLLTTTTVIMIRVETMKRLGVESRRWNAECCGAVSLWSRSTGRLSAILTGTLEMFRFALFSKSFGYVHDINVLACLNGVF